MGSIPGFAQWVGDPICHELCVVQVAGVAQIWRCCGCGIGWQAAVALKGPLAWELPYEGSTALKSKKKKKSKPAIMEKNKNHYIFF